jgi:predicted permease
LILVTLVVLASTAVGVVADRRTDRAVLVSRACLRTMLYVLIPFVAFVNFAHLRLSVGGAVGLGVAWIGLALAGLIAYAVARRLGLESPAIGALILGVLVVNTGYLGYPVTVALLGHGALPRAVVYDQAVSTPLVFTLGFAIGATFGEHVSGARGPLRTLLVNPPLWAAVAGLIGGPALAPHVLVSVGDNIVDAFLVLGFFTVGVALSSEGRALGVRLFERPDRAVLSAMALRFSVNPALLAVVSVAGVGIPSAYLLQAVMPSGINGLIVAHTYGLDLRLIASVIVWSTLAVLVVALAAYVV